MKKGWETKTLGEVLQKTETINPLATPHKDFVYVDVSSVNNSTLRIEATSTIKGRDAPSRARKLIRTGDVIFATIRPTLQRIATVPADLNNQVCSTGYFVLRGNAIVHTPFLFYYLLTDTFTDSMERLQAGASYPAVTDSDVRSQKIPLPPLPEQRRIVSILDEAFEGISKARSHAETNLRNSREVFQSRLQSIFAAQGDGWSRVQLETLLKRGWIESHLDGNHGGDYPRKEEFISEGVPYISANCIDGEQVDMSRAKHLSHSRAALLRKGIAKDRDVLFAHNATVGPVAILHTKEEKVILGTSLTYYRCNQTHILPEYLAHYMRSFQFKTQYLEVMQQSTRNQVPITKQREFWHLVPPIAEQRRIITSLDQLFADTGHLAIIYRKKLADLEELKKAILQKAFNGELKVA